MDPHHIYRAKEEEKILFLVSAASSLILQYKMLLSHSLSFPPPSIDDICASEDRLAFVVE